MDEQIKNITTEQGGFDAGFDLMEYWRVLDRAKWKVAIFTIVIAACSVYYSLTLTPQYSATARLILESEKANTVSVREIYDINETNRNYYMTQLEMLRSRKLVEKVIYEYDLLNKPDFDQLRPKYTTVENSDDVINNLLPEEISTINDSDAQKEIERLIMEDAVEIYLAKLTLIPVMNTQLINITFDSADPQLAAVIANGHAEMYIRSFLESKLEMEAKASTWMNERLGTIKDKLTAAEANLQSFLEKEGLVDVRGISSLAQAELNDLSSQLSEARQGVSQAKTVYDLTTSVQSVDELMSVPEVLNHPVIRQVRSAELQAEQRISELSQRYGPRHRSMIAANAELDTVRANLQQEIRKLVSGIENEYRSEQTNLNAVNDKFEKAKSDFQRLSRIDREYQRLQKEVQTTQDLYSAFFTRLKETSETSGFQTPNAQILDYAVPPRWPSKPSKRKIVVLATGAAFAFAVGLVFLLDFLSGGVRSLEDVERRLGQRMLGLVPLQKLKKGESLPNDQFFEENAKGFSEAIRTIRTSLLMSFMDSSPKVIAVTSAIPHEGKSVLATNLAFALGQMEKVLLIDADLRRPSLGKRFGYPPYQPGLSNLIANTANLSSCIVKDKKSGIDILLAGAIPPNPQELLSSELMKTAMKLLMAKYDRIIIDTAPTQAVADSLIVSTIADAMVFAIKADSTHIKTIKSGIGRLLQVGANVAGVVLNHVDLEQSAKYGDYQGYYDQYGYNLDSQEVLDSQARVDESQAEGTSSRKFK